MQNLPDFATEIDHNPQATHGLNSVIKDILLSFLVFVLVAGPQKRLRGSNTIVTQLQSNNTVICLSLGENIELSSYNPDMYYCWIFKRKELALA